VCSTPIVFFWGRVNLGFCFRVLYIVGNWEITRMWIGSDAFKLKRVLFLFGSKSPLEPRGLVCLVNGLHISILNSCTSFQEAKTK
jgi:hypothetical protein